MLFTRFNSLECRSIWLIGWKLDSKTNSKYRLKLLFMENSLLQYSMLGRSGSKRIKQLSYLIHTNLIKITKDKYLMHSSITGKSKNT